ncbi:MAG: alpha-2-macroglobulin [Candidatus Marinimicrobia bacterium]|nr:alpha-2-macroglobulin [Candidatus Neomarinimicrobiota bacterium]
MTVRKRLWGVVGFAWAGWVAGVCAAGDFAALKTQAEALFAAGSYSQAAALYAQAADWDLAPEQARWRDFRLADSRWRADAAAPQADDSAYREAGRALERQVRDRDRPSEQDRIWAEGQESLGDFHWLSRRQRNWHQAWTYYERALDWWAGAPDIETARSRYLGIVWKASSWPDTVWGWNRQFLPLPILDNLHRIAQTPGDRARSALLLASGLIRGGSPRRQQKIPELFDLALAGGRETGFYDEALMQYADWLANQGRATQDEQGRWTRTRDYPAALALYRRLLHEFREGESRHWRQAKSRIEQITRKEISARVAHTFLPESEIELFLNWRNISELDLELALVNLPRDVALRGRDNTDWLAALEAEPGVKPVRKWQLDTEDTGAHEPGSRTLRLPALPIGAYLLTVRADGQTARELVLVTDLALVIKQAPGQALLWVCDALTGAPVPDARLAFWQSYHEGRRWHWELIEAVSDADGLALLTPPTRSSLGPVVALAAAGPRQALATSHGQSAPSPQTQWKLYVFSDRPAYRPEDQVHWRVWARRIESDAARTPAGAALAYVIRDPRGGEAARGTLELNEFGAAGAEVALQADWPLGMYRIEFMEPADSARGIGGGDLFRLEEYKLPEFKVAVAAPTDEDGAPRSFLPGEEITIEVTADYYFGGPVRDAEVEIIINENPFWFRFPEPRPYPWLYATLPPPPYWGQSQVLRRETLRTDADGRAQISFVPPERGEQDREYRIEARVTDAARREIIGQGQVRVTRQRYYVQAKPTHWIQRPGDQATVNITALDPNERPVSVTGQVRIVREYEHEIWVAPDGREVFGPSLRRLRAGAAIWPPPDAQPRWRLRRPGRERQEVWSQSLTTDADGAASLTFTPEREGHYRIYWVSPQADGPHIQADTMVWVADRETTEIGVRVGRLQLIADRETFKLGERAPVMLVTPSSGRDVLFGVEAEQLLSWQRVRLDGNVKLLEVPIGEEHLPNAWLSALMIQDAQAHQAEVEIVVPPDPNYLEVTAAPSAEAVEPRAEVEWTLTARDHAGDPVAAELAFSLADDSVFYIQDEIAGDPRAFFFGGRRAHSVQTRSSFEEKAYRKLMPEPPPPPDEFELFEDVEYEAFGNEESPVAMRGLLAWRSGGGRADRMRKSEMMESVDADGLMAVSAAAPMMAMDATAEMEPPAAPGEAAAAVVVRSDFRATAAWFPDIQTDENGQARVRSALPESLTAWRGIVRAVTGKNQMGWAQATIRTRLPLMARLQTPRFLVVGDEAVLSAILNNQTEADLTVEATLEQDVLEWLGADRMQTVEIPAGGEARVEWRVRAAAPGAAALRLTARGGAHADAMERTLPVREHGLDRQITIAGKADAEVTELTLELPAARKPGTTTLEVRIAPSLAVTLLEALPYLADYPYGCTEQTLSRFLPAVSVAATLRTLGLDPAVAARYFTTPVPGAPKSHPKGPGDLTQLEAMTRAGLERLYDFQHDSGGWGWWKEGATDPYMSAYVLWGLSLARDAGLEVRPTVLERAADYLRRRLVDFQEQPDQQAWLLHALAYHRAGAKPHEFEEKALDNLWGRHTGLNAYSRALFAIAAHRSGRAEWAQLLARNLENGVQRDAAPGHSRLVTDPQPDNPLGQATAHWGRLGIVRWSENASEATAFALTALLEITPDNELIGPVMNWLIKNRRGAHWGNTRATAMAVLAANRYLQVSGELAAPVAYRLEVNGQLITEQDIAAADLFTAPTRFEVPSALIRDGANQIVLRRTSVGPLYLAAQANFYSLEKPIPAGGHEIFVRRDYYRYRGRPTLLKGYVYEREPLRDGEPLAPGDRIEVILTLEAKNDYEYLVFEDARPAGFESVVIQSGGPLDARELRRGGVDRRLDPTAQVEQPDYTGRRQWIYREIRDQHTALFLDRLPEGYWEIRYDYRAETPGLFHALPVAGHAMYLPELRCNSAEQTLIIQDAPLPKAADSPDS